ncbi:predicted protein [Plenodomus lingam JN3]|uniref:Predicted protein n=1 Tax=Leptosphaeria maculans (strain JN3 / isolate v23.1.3 / race Av1-4-5-6-7-8) TaxID=985895 RepID=E4ZT67_LEPMJ|nr:predicted protein [Plenodomus lingam JN3]CBX94498.1 predicted protein [Plenodomus lingam JN3]
MHFFSFIPNNEVGMFISMLLLQVKVNFVYQPFADGGKIGIFLH